MDSYYPSSIVYSKGSYTFYYTHCSGCIYILSLVKVKEIILIDPKLTFSCPHGVYITHRMQLTLGEEDGFR